MSELHMRWARGLIDYATSTRPDKQPTPTTDNMFAKKRSNPVILEFSRSSTRHRPSHTCPHDSPD